MSATDQDGQVYNSRLFQVAFPTRLVTFSNSSSQILVAISSALAKLALHRLHYTRWILLFEMATYSEKSWRGPLARSLEHLIHTLDHGAEMHCRKSRIIRKFIDRVAVSGQRGITYRKRTVNTCFDSCPRVAKRLRLSPSN